jgi:hypothetical protein
LSKWGGFYDKVDYLQHAVSLRADAALFTKEIAALFALKKCPALANAAKFSFDLCDFL